MSGLTLDDAKSAAEDAQQGSLRSNDAGIPDDLAYDYEQHDAPIVQGHPEAMIEYDYVAGFTMFNTPDDFLSRRQNLEADHYTKENDVILTFANPELVEGTLWQYSDEDSFKDYKVIGDPENDQNPYELREDIVRDDEGNVTGAETTGIGSIGPSSFDGTPVEDGFDSEYVQILVSASRATDILGVLDTAGMWATDQEGNVIEGIIETPPNFGTDDYDSDEDGAPRAIGYPELRSDMVDQRGAITWTFDVDDGELPNSQSPTEINLFKIEDGELEALTPLTPEDDAYALPSYPRAGNLYWDDSDNTGNVGADATPETDDGVAEAQAMMNDGDGESSDVLYYEDLTDDGQDFVDSGVEAMEARDYNTVSQFDDFDERVAQAKSEGNIEASEQDLREIINMQA